MREKPTVETLQEARSAAEAAALAPDPVRRELEVRKDQVSIFASTPAETVRYATEIANALAPVISQQNMYVMISKNKHVKVEAWLTLGAIVGVTPKEDWVKELPDGSYEARVDLVNQTGRVVGGASSICGIEEPRWRGAERYARRSMAVTRATAKAYRLSFGWIMQLAGYQPTPAEEMPHEDRPPQKEIKRVTVSHGTSAVVYDPDNYKHSDQLTKTLRSRQIHEGRFVEISEALKGRPTTDLDLVLKDLQG